MAVNRSSNTEVTFELMEHLSLSSHERMGRGITLMEDTAEKLAKALTSRYEK